MKLSHSAKQRFDKCSESYRLHYVERLRSPIQSSALLWGSALDKAIEELLLNKNRTTPVDVKQIYTNAWYTAKINDVEEELPLNTKLSYYLKDFDSDILIEEDYLKVYSFMDRKSISGNLNEIHKELARKYNKTEEETQFVNYVYWLCLYRKGLMLIDAYEKDILPRINKVIQTQQKIELKNKEGDTIEGFVDLICEWEDGKTYIMDNKSSSRPYPEDAVVTSEQLALYERALNIGNAGYLVYIKNLHKQKMKSCNTCGFNQAKPQNKSCPNVVKGVRCGSELTERVISTARTQVVLGAVPDDLKRNVMHGFNTVLTKVKNGEFKKNPEMCSNWFGQRCIYFDTCHNNTKNGLIKV